MEDEEGERVRVSHTGLEGKREREGEDQVVVVRDPKRKGERKV